MSLKLFTYLFRNTLYVANNVFLFRLSHTLFLHYYCCYHFTYIITLIGCAVVVSKLVATNNITDATIHVKLNAVQRNKESYTVYVYLFMSIHSFAVRCCDPYIVLLYNTFTVIKSYNTHTLI